MNSKNTIMQYYNTGMSFKTISLKNDENRTNRSETAERESQIFSKTKICSNVTSLQR